MIKLLLGFLLILALSISAAWFAERPGLIQIYWLNHKIETSINVIVTSFLILFLIFFIIFRLWSLIYKKSFLIKFKYKERKLNKGVRELTKGMVALAIGDSDNAQKFSQKAINIPENLKPLSVFLSAHSLQLQGNKNEAKDYFKSMLDYPEMEFLGLRGLIILGGLKNSSPLMLAKRAYSVKPNSPWVISAVYELESKEGNWRGAEKVIKNTLKFSKNESKKYNKKLAIALFEQGKIYEQEGHSDKLQKLLESFKIDPSFIPNSIYLVKNLINRKQRRKAVRIVEKTWTLAPHPILMELIENIYVKESQTQINKKLIELALKAPIDHPESLYTLAKVKFSERNIDESKKYLLKILKIYLDYRAVEMMIEISKINKENKRISEWSEKLSSAVKPSWVCQICSEIQEAWTPYCNKCNSFDSIEWKYSEKYSYKTISLNESDIIYNNVFHHNEIKSK